VVKCLGSRKTGNLGTGTHLDGFGVYQAHGLFSECPVIREGIIIESMVDIYFLLFGAVAFVLMGWWIYRKPLAKGRSETRPFSRNAIQLCAVLLIVLGGFVVAFVTSARFPLVFLFLLGATFVRVGWWIHRTFIPSTWFGNMRRPIFRRIANIYATAMIFAGVFAIILAVVVRFLAISHVVVSSVLASCVATRLLRPRGATLVNAPPAESSVMPQVVGLFCVGLACSALLGAGTLFWVMAGFDQPNDRQLQRRFKDQRTDFERLANMMTEDHNMALVSSGRIEPTDTDGISEARWNDYRTLLKRIGVDAVLRRDSGDIALDVWSNVFIHGTHLDYIHCGSRDPSKGRATLIWPCVEARETGNGQDSSSQNGFVYTYRYKKIAQEWYILEVSY